MSMIPFLIFVVMVALMAYSGWKRKQEREEAEDDASYREAVSGRLSPEMKRLTDEGIGTRVPYPKRACDK
jgi:hypothetical protein